MGILILEIVFLMVILVWVYVLVLISMFWCCLLFEWIKFIKIFLWLDCDMEILILMVFVFCFNSWFILFKVIELYIFGLCRFKRFKFGLCKIKILNKNK